MTNEGAGNQRVTNALLQVGIANIEKKLDILPDMQDKLHDIDKRTEVVCNKVDRNEVEISSLRKRSNITDAILAAGALVAGLIGWKQ